MSVRLTLCALAVLTSACASDTPTTVEDDLGREVRLDGTPQRVLPLAPVVRDLIAEVAGADRLASAPEEERPLPDLALGLADVTPLTKADELAELGIPAYLVRLDVLNDVPRVLRTLDSLLASDRGAPAAGAFETRVQTVQRAVAPFDAPRVLLVADSDPDRIDAYGRESYASEIVRIAGGDNVTDVFPGTTSQPSAEAVVDLAPQVILVLGDTADAESLISDHPALVQTPAVQNRRVIAVDADLLSSLGLHSVDALEQIARRIHPEAFAAGAA
ncbi:MAG: ABC transporter substrate-binding protein [Bacteroidota bacterium]